MSTQRILARLGVIAVVLILADPVLAQRMRSEVYPILNLFAAVRDGDIVAVRQELEKGTWPNDLDKDGKTVLVYAVINGNAEMVEVLLQGKATVDLKDEGGNTALMWAAAQGEVAVAKILIDGGAIIDAQNRRGESPLIKAIENGKRQMIRTLIAHGANVNLADYTGRAPLVWAKQSRWPGNTRILKKAGAR